jgi:hypothetical protein
MGSRLRDRANRLVAAKHLLAAAKEHRPTAAFIDNITALPRAEHDRRVSTHHSSLFPESLQLES